MKNAVKKANDGDSMIGRVFQAAGIGLALVDADGRFLRGNPAVLALFQVTEEELLSKALPDFCAPQDASACYDLIHEVAFCDAKVEEQELKVMLPGGDVLWVHVTASAVQNEGAPCIVLTVHNTSDYFEVQEEMEQGLPQKKLATATAPAAECIKVVMR